MTEAAPRHADLQVGDQFRGRSTITEAHVVLATGVFGDFASVYTDESFAAGTRHGTRIVPANLLGGIMSGVLGKALSESMLGLVEQSYQFLTPVLPGETVTTEWTVRDSAEAPSGERLVRLDVTCLTEAGEVAATGAATITLS